MKPIWAIQTNEVSRLQAEAVANAVILCGGRAVEVEVRASSGITFLNGSDPDTLDLIPYGSTEFVKLAMEQVWTGVFRNTQFSVPIWNQNRQDMLNQDSVFTLAKDLPEYMRSMPADSTVFIRPMIGKKLFPGQTAAVADVHNWLKLGQAGRYPFLPETEVAVAKTKNILAETRWFVVGGKVIDGSTYRLRGQRVLIHENNESHLKEAQQMANIWLPHPTCVMDLAETDEGLRVVEFNTFNSSGFYHHDIPKIIRAVHESV